MTKAAALVAYRGRRCSRVGGDLAERAQMVLLSAQGMDVGRDRESRLHPARPGAGM